MKDSGVYALDYAAIITAQPGLADCRADELALWQRDDEVPIRVLGAQGGRFVSGASIQWLGQMLHGPESWFDQYSSVNVYQLGAAAGTHARLREIPAPASGKSGSGMPASLIRRLHFERENLMIRLGSEQMKPGEEPDVFQWAKLTPIDPKPFSFGFDLPDAGPRGAGLRRAGVPLTLDFRGESNVLTPPKGQAKPPDHVVDVSINGKRVQTLQWDGRGEMRRTFEVPGNLLKPADNTLALSVPRRADPANAQNFIIDVVMFNWADVSYPIRGDIERVDGGVFGSRHGADRTARLPHPQRNCSATTARCARDCPSANSAFVSPAPAKKWICILPPARRWPRPSCARWRAAICALPIPDSIT